MESSVQRLHENSREAQPSTPYNWTGLNFRILYFHSSRNDWIRGRTVLAPPKGMISFNPKEVFPLNT